jgi:hypothetical protein
MRMAADKRITTPDSVPTGPSSCCRIRQARTWDQLRDIIAGSPKAAAVLAPCDPLLAHRQSRMLRRHREARTFLMDTHVRWPREPRRRLPGSRSRLTDLSVGAGTAGSVDGGADAVDLGVIGPAVDPAAVVADLHATHAGVDCGDQVQVDRTGDSGQDDVADLYRRPAAAARVGSGGIGPVQFGQSARPCSSRVAASQTRPQREQGSARDLATQVRQSRTPPRGLTSGITRPQCGQGGRTTPLAPASQSVSIRRSTAGIVASAPVPVSSSGRSCNVQAS